MALEQKLKLQLSQRLVMTPSLQQAIKLLQMTRLELEGVLTQELVENPVLEENDETPEPAEEEERQRDEQPQQETTPAADELDHEKSLAEVDIEAYFGDWDDAPRPRANDDRELPPLENNLTREPDLSEDQGVRIERLVP